MYYKRMDFYLFLSILLLAFMVATSARLEKRNNNNNNNHKRQLKQRKQQQSRNSSPASNGFLAYNDNEDFAYSDQESDSQADSGMQATDADGNDKFSYDIFACCNEVYGSCRTSCEDLSLVNLATTDTTGRSIRLELRKYCAPVQFEFWNCMNRTLEAVARGAQWSGRRCCALGLSPHCRNACATSGSIDELINAAKCRQSDEQHMFACFERQEAGDRCCGNARTSECLQACREIFEPYSPNKRKHRHHIEEMCDERNSDVLQCVRNVTDMTPMTNSHQYLHCCDYSQVESCRHTCRDVLNTTESKDIIIGELQNGGCGMPLPHLPLWKCFFTAHAPTPTYTAINKISQINQIGIDSAKLHCCDKAYTPKCKRLCMKTYSTDWTTSSSVFENSCLLQPNELELRQCIDEVDEPCELGCDGLSFCTNFNNRPTELFRSCNAEADAAARSDLKMWQQRGFVSLPGVHLPIRNMTRCAPQKWQAIACALQIKPCTRTGYNHICREDCTEILNECMDWIKMNSTLNTELICARLNPAKDGPCISLKPYLEESDAPKETGGHHRLTQPCRGHPCNASEVCLPHRNESNSFTCISGCSLGEASNYLVPFGAYVRIPVSNIGRAGSFKVCRCGAKGQIEHCQPLPNFSYENCVLGEKVIKHAESFYLECNLCSCFAGEITCTKKQCRFPAYTDISYTSLPCNCPTHYVPVCGRNGNTYSSACIAKCLGLKDSDFEYGACSSWNPCQKGTYSCAAGMQCLEQRTICLSSMHRPCLQYKCVNQTSNCSNTGQPVCDIKGYTYTSACELLNAKAQLSYWGSCFQSCSTKGPVCGINGVTYAHECAAWADFIVIDYRSRCREIGLLTHDMGRRCRTVKCPNPSSPYCKGIVPPGACCPICGGAFRVIYSRKQIDRALYALRGQNRELLTLHSILREIDSLVQVSECQLTGYLTMEVGIFVAVIPRTNSPTRIQIEACTREAEKISALIETQSHKITTNLILSSLTVSHMLDPSLESSTDSLSGSNTIKIFLVCFLFIQFRWPFL